MKRLIKGAVAALGCTVVGCLCAAVGCAPEDAELPFKGETAEVKSASVVYVDGDGFDDGSWSGESVLTDARFETGETYYMVLDFTYGAVADNDGARSLSVGLEISPSAVVEATLFSADSGITDESVINDRLRVTADYKVPEKAGEEKQQRIILRFKPKRVDYALFSYGFAENGGDPFIDSVRERLYLTYGEGAYTEGLSFRASSDGKGYAVSGIGSADTRIIKVPKNNNGKPVTEVEANAFQNNLQIAEVILPDGMLTIGVGAFRGCKGLESITIPSTVTAISESAFQGCICLENITLEGVQSIGRYAFADCSALTSVAVNYGSQTISVGAFKGCSGLASVELPLSLNSISEFAFEGCTSLREIVIPSSVKTVGESAFNGCTLLGRVTLSDRITSISKNTFTGCQSLTVISIPASVTEICASAFSECASLSTVEISHGVNTIGASAFYKCENLTAITIPKSVYLIADSAFMGSGLKSADFLQKNGWKNSSGSVDVSDVSAAARVLRDGLSLYR